jgi:hypothetical protein
MTVPAPDIPQLLQRAERVVLTASLILDVVDAYATAIDPSASPARPSGGLRVSLVESAAGTKNAQPIDPPLPLSTITNPSGYQLWFGRRTDDGPSPDPGSYTLRIDSDLYAPFLSGPVQIPTSNSAIRCALQPGYAYPFGGGGLAASSAAPTLLRGALQNVDGSGQAGATVAVSGGTYSGQYLTDASGQFVLAIPDPAPPTVAVDIAYADGTTTSLPNVTITPGVTNALPQTVLTGRVITTALGATVRLSAPARSVGVAPDGTWRMFLPLDQKAASVTVSATAAGQRKKPQSKIKIAPGQVVPVPPFVFKP